MAKSDDNKGSDSKAKKPAAKKKSPTKRKKTAQMPLIKKKAAKVEALPIEEVASEDATEIIEVTEDSSDDATIAAATVASADAEAATHAAAAINTLMGDDDDDDDDDEIDDDVNVIVELGPRKTYRKRKAELYVPLDITGGGLFDEGKIDDTLAVDAPEVGVFRPRRSRVTSILGLVATAAIVVVVILGLTVEKYNDDMRHFLGMVTDANGNVISLGEYKRAESERLKMAARDEDAASQNRYGNVVLSYFPRTAKVRVWQIKYEQDGLKGTPAKVGKPKLLELGKACKNDIQCLDKKVINAKEGDFEAEEKDNGLSGASLAAKVASRLQSFKQMTSAGLCNETKGLCKNPTLHLQPGQTITAIPLASLPLFEAEKITEGKRKGAVGKVHTYAYKIQFELEGYCQSPKECQHLLPALWQQARTDDGGGWQMGAGNLYIYPWPGKDLPPNVETLKANYLKFKRELQCYVNKNRLEIQSIEDLKTVHGDWLDRQLGRYLFKDAMMVKDTQDFLEESSDEGTDEIATKAVKDNTAAQSSNVDCKSSCFSEGAKSGEIRKDADGVPGCVCEIPHRVWWEREWPKMQTEVIADDECKPLPEEGEGAAK